MINIEFKTYIINSFEIYYYSKENEINLYGFYFLILFIYNNINNKKCKRNHLKNNILKSKDLKRVRIF